MINLIRRYWFAVLTSLLFALLLVGIGYWFWLGGSRFPVITRGSDFTMVNAETGRPVRMRDTDGKVRLMTFYFTRCTDACPITAFQMEQIQNRLKKEKLFGSRVVFLSITIDPEHDTIPVIRQFASHYHADRSGWEFLRGDPNVTQRVLADYGIAVQLSPDTETLEHATKTLLVDGSGNVRKIYYDAKLDPPTVVRDIQALLEQ